MTKTSGVDRTALENFHSSVAIAFSKAVKVSSKIHMLGEITDWESAVAGTKVYFEMRPSKEVGPLETFVGDRGGQRILYLLSEEGSPVSTWSSWSEEWCKKATDPKERKPKPALDLIGFSLAFYVGNQWGQKTQVIRAEWDDPTRRGPDAAQPHWHIDPKLLDVPSWEESPFADVASEEAGDLNADEITENLSAPGFWSLKKLHLGMAGWSHANEPPRCWQHDIGVPQLKEIAGWVSKVIAYCKREMEKVAAER